MCNEIAPHITHIMTCLGLFCRRYFYRCIAVVFVTHNLMICMNERQKCNEFYKKVYCVLRSEYFSLSFYFCSYGCRSVAHWFWFGFVLQFVVFVRCVCVCFYNFLLQNHTSTTMGAQETSRTERKSVRAHEKWEIL